MRRYFLPLALLILLVASALRLYGLHQYPPGPHYDEAVYLLITRSIAFGGARFFPIVEAYQGREVLWMYLNAPLLSLFGDSIFTLRITSVFCNLITIAASIALGRAIFPGRRGLLVGLAVGVMFALSFPQVWLARQAFRAVTLPMMQALALLFLWWGLKRDSPLQPSPQPLSQGKSGFGAALQKPTVFRRMRQASNNSPSLNLGRSEAAGMGVGYLYLLLGGIFAGGALYTYMASRLFPLWLIIGGLALLVFDRRHWKLRLAQGAVFFSALVVVAAPMAVYAIQKPEIFLGRLGEVTQVEESISLLNSIYVHFLMFFIQGDPYLRYNIPQRPYFTLLEGLFFLVGILVLFWRLTRKTTPPMQRTAYLLALLSPLMTIPSVISVGGLPPSHMRSLGMIPLIFVLVAVGFEIVAGRLRDRTVSTLMAVVVLVGGVLVGNLYLSWAGRADVFYETDADLASAAEWLVRQPPDENTLVYVAARDRGHPTMTVQPIPPVTWIGTDSLFRPPAGKTGLYIFPRSAPPPADWQAWLEAGQVTDLPLAPDGRTAFEAFYMAGDAALPASSTPPEAVRSPYLTLIGTHTGAIASGGAGEVVMDWQIENPPPFPDLTPLLQLEDENRAILDRADMYVTETNRWRAGEVLMHRMPVRVPVGTPPGRYQLRVAWVGRAEDQYVPYFRPDNSQGGIWATVGTLEVVRPSEFPDPAALPTQTRHDIDLAPGVRLLSWDAPPVTLRPGEPLPISLYWVAIQNAQATVRVRALLRGEGGEVALWEGAPGGSYPSDRWVRGELVHERAVWDLPREVASGQYTLFLQTDDTEIELGQITIEGVARVFEPPPVQHVLNASFGGIITLYGYSLNSDGSNLELELIWRAETNIDRNYTVFRHLTNNNGEIIAQHDSAPANNYSTSLWRPQEYITDRYQFSNISGDLTVRVGLYWAEDGTRLDVNKGLTDYIDLKD
jgi:4-amino-4-deoxy-L-arabinose transferase-like glycosyltransferase